MPKHVTGRLNDAETRSRIYCEMIWYVFVSVCSITRDEILNNMSVARNMNNIIF